MIHYIDPEADAARPGRAETDRRGGQAVLSTPTGGKGRTILKRTIRSVAVLLVGTLLMTLVGCRLGWPNFSKSKGKSASSHTASSAVSTASAASSAAAATVFSLPMALGRDMNPLKTDSMTNLTLWPLLFDSLAEPDSGYSTQWCLASSADISGSTVTVHLRSGVHFTDGTALTAKDVLYSYNAVRGDSASFFYANTTNIANITFSGNYTVIFTLKSPDALFANLLNIPIIKSGSDTTATAVGSSPCPIGSGRYSYSDNALNGTLTVNKSWYKGTAPTIQTIRLINMLDSSATLSSLKTGVINYLYADWNGATVATAGLQTASVGLNRMVFLGVNWSNSFLANAHVRRAVSMAIDRSSIVSEAFSSRAKASLLPFNPDWAELVKLNTAASGPSAASTASSASSASSKTARSSSSKTASGASAASVDSDTANTTVDRADVTNELTAAGLPAKSGSSATLLTLRLLVDSGNTQMMTAAKKIVSSLSPSGIAVTIDAEPASAYASKLSAGQYDLYLGEIRLTDDMDISPLFQGGTAGFGAPATSQTQTAFTGWRAGSVTLSSLADTFRTEEPFIPLCFRLGTVAYSTGLKGTVAPTYADIFQNAEGWHFN